MELHGISKIDELVKSHEVPRPAGSSTGFGVMPPMLTIYNNSQSLNSSIPQST